MIKFLKKCGWWVVGSCVLMSLTSCQLEQMDTNARERRDMADALTTRAAPVRYSVPRDPAGGGRWTPVTRQGGSEYVMPKNGMDDVVSLYAFIHPLDAEVKTNVDFMRVVGAEFSALQETTLNGVSVVRFEKVVKDTAGAPARHVTALGMPPRSPGAYSTVTRGAFVILAGKTRQLATLAVSRSSSHGTLGGMFEATFEQYLTDFVSRNPVTSLPKPR